jgi:hypothetical protein
MREPGLGFQSGSQIKKCQTSFIVRTGSRTESAFENCSTLVTTFNSVDVHPQLSRNRHPVNFGRDKIVDATIIYY